MKIFKYYIWVIVMDNLRLHQSTGKGERGDPGLPGIGFNLTDDGNFDIDGEEIN